jgi:putative membrane protein
MLLAMSALALAGCSERRGPAPPDGDPGPDRRLVASREALVLEALHQDDQHEIAVAQMAQDRATAPGVKELAARLVSDHQDIDSRIVDYATDRKLDLIVDTTEQQRKDRECTQARDWLHARDGAEFDHAFVNMMVIHHQKALALVDDARETATANGFKNLLSGLAPVLHRHLEQARQLSMTTARAAAPVQARRRLPERPR